jgi:undecaprenyl-diphosphatase
MLFEAALLGIIQGLAEFLPISSSAHLTLVPLVFHWESPLLNSLSFDVALHAGTLLAVATYFREDLWEMTSCWWKPIDSLGRRENRRLGLLILLATIPGAWAGVQFEHMAETVFRHPAPIAWTLILGGILMGLTDHFGKQEREASRLSGFKAFVTGCFQAVAILPGISRSGSTLTCLRFLGVRRPDAARFSFLLSVPLVAGAAMFKTKHLLHILRPGEIAPMAAGVFSSWVAGFLVIHFFIRLLRKRTLLPFAVYRVALGIFVLLWFYS